MLGRLIEIVSGKSLYEFEKERILDPLETSNTSFYVTDAAKRSRIAQPYDRSFGVDATIGDPTEKFDPGHPAAAAWSPPREITHALLQMFLNGGSLDGKRILGSKTIAYMTSGSSELKGYLVVPTTCRAPAPALAWASRCIDRRAGNGPGAARVFGSNATDDMFVVFMMQSPKQRLHYRTLLRDMTYSAIENDGRC